MTALNLTPPVLPQAPRFKLYDYRAIMGASFLGTPATGTVLMARNYSRLGRPFAAFTTVVLGVIATFILLPIAVILPAVAIIGATVPAVVMNFVARIFQGKAVRQHLQAGGAKVSQGRALAAGLLGLCVTVALVLGLGAISLNYGHGRRVAIGNNDEIYYRDGITKQAAQDVGKVLQDCHYFTNHSATVLLSAKPDGKVITYIVKDGIWNDPMSVTGFRLVTYAVSPKLGGLPLTMQVADQHGVVKKEEKVK